MIKKLLAGIIVSVSVLELNCQNCCSCCKNDKANDDYGKNPKPKPKPEPNPNPNPITHTIPESELNVFKSIKIQRCTRTDTGKTLNCVEITKKAHNAVGCKFKDVIDDITVYGVSARLFEDNDHNYLLVFTKDIKNNIKYNEILSKIYKVSEGVYLLYCYYVDEYKYGVISRVTQDDEDKNIFSVECHKV